MAEPRYLINVIPTKTRVFLTKAEARLACERGIGVLDMLVLEGDYSVRNLTRKEQKEIWE